METRHSSFNKGRMKMEINMELDLIGDQQRRNAFTLLARAEMLYDTDSSCRLWSVKDHKVRFWSLKDQRLRLGL